MNRTNKISLKTLKSSQDILSVQLTGIIKKIRTQLKKILKTDDIECCLEGYIKEKQYRLEFLKAEKCIVSISEFRGKVALESHFTGGIHLYVNNNLILNFRHGAIQFGDVYISDKERQAVFCEIPNLIQEAFLNTSKEESKSVSKNVKVKDIEIEGEETEKNKTFINDSCVLYKQLKAFYKKRMTKAKINVTEKFTWNISFYIDDRKILIQEYPGARLRQGDQISIKIIDENVFQGIKEVFIYHQSDCKSPDNTITSRERYIVYKYIKDIIDKNIAI